MIYKINKDNLKEYFVRLDRIVEINKKEYNIFIDFNNLSAVLLSVDTPFSTEIDLTSFLGKKVGFEFDSKSNKITSIECED